MKRASLATIMVSLIVLSTVVVYSADAAGIPKKAISLASRFIESDLPVATVFTDQANTFSAGLKQIFQASSTTAGIGITGVSSDPSGLSAGDVWFNSGSTNALKFSATGGTQTIVAYTGTCGNNQILVYSTGTNTWSCTAQSSGGITSINSQTGPSITLNRGSVTNMSSITNSSNVISYQLKSNIVQTNGSKQTISKTLNIKGGDFTTSKCPNSYALKYQSSNSTWVCTPVAFTDLNFDTNPSQQISGAGSNITFNNQGGNSGIHSINIGTDVLVKNKPFTITANDIFSGFTAFTGNTQIKGGNFTTSTCPTGETLMYQSSNSTWICSAFVSGAIGTANNVTVSASSGAVTWNLGSNAVVTGGSAQTISKGLTLNSLTLGGDAAVGSNALANGGHKSTLPTTSGVLCQTNQTGTCGPTPAGTDVVLANNVTSSSTSNFAHVWNIALTANSGNSIQGVLVATSNTAGGAVQVGANMSNIAHGSGLCTFTYGSAAATLTPFSAALATTSSDSAWTTWLAGANQAAPIFFNCAVVTDASPPTLQINFQAEVASTVAIKAGSYYTKTP